MTVIYTTAALVALGLFVYLTYALLATERFS